MGVPCRVLAPYETAHGWVVMSINKMLIREFELREREQKRAGAYSWIRPYKRIERIGKSMWLYKVD